MTKMAECGGSTVQEDVLSHMITASKGEASNVITRESFTDSLLTFMFGGCVRVLNPLCMAGVHSG